MIKMIYIILNIEKVKKGEVYEKSKRFVEFEKLKNLISVDKKQVYFISVLVNPDDVILEKIKDLSFDYYQLYDVNPIRTKEIKSKFKKKNNHSSHYFQ